MGFGHWPWLADPSSQDFSTWVWQFLVWGRGSALNKVECLVTSLASTPLKARSASTTQLWPSEISPDVTPWEADPPSAENHCLIQKLTGANCDIWWPKQEGILGEEDCSVQKSSTVKTEVGLLDLATQLLASNLKHSGWAQGMVLHLESVEDGRTVRICRDPLEFWQEEQRLEARGRGGVVLWWEPAELGCMIWGFSVGWEGLLSNGDRKREEKEGKGRGPQATGRQESFENSSSIVTGRKPNTHKCVPVPIFFPWREERWQVTGGGGLGS